MASRIKAPHAVLNKRRAGDESVAIKLPDLSACVGHQPVLVDDIIASGATMLEATHLLRRAGWPAPICLGVHGVFAPECTEPGGGPIRLELRTGPVGCMRGLGDS